ncbi:hypothetical protein [Streptomyces sp. SID8352]|uniref:DUF6197 family protein n=1 Tax=Streptomyces sp. SID8352 TaxID=2690338 RepID=UPI0013695C14|nr:hypothetical protein [Streptomyces sp. SID8352]MYU20805.1 hypothetical protein [Streptomyces sp. SID8352]
MTMILSLPASPPQAPPALDLEARLALTGAAMTARLAEAAVAFEVNTAHLPGADPVPHIAEAVPPRLAPPAGAFRTPIAVLLHRALHRIESDGWCRDALHDDQGAVCPVRAIRLEAHGDRALADDACTYLLARIQADFANAETIPSWNAQQTSAAPVLRALDRAAHHAHTHQQ